jgi:putative addiction module component (TIGR02574 family)
MTSAAKSISEAAKDLSPSERVELVKELLDSLDIVDPKLDQLWAAESGERWAAFRRGEIEAVPLSTVVAKHRPG